MTGAEAEPLRPGRCQLGKQAGGKLLDRVGRRAVEQVVGVASGGREFGAEAVVIALGYDAHKDDPIGVLKLEASDFGTIGRQVKAFGLPTLVVQEGGYAIEAIGDCLDAFLGGFK